ncbi:MAG: hypothetical protein M1826_005657 [Phylliscum demangeonii]|nr:MAG: hypothetical protein M1826_005657 [Phylliscum demangeonii]
MATPAKRKRNHSPSAFASIAANGDCSAVDCTRPRLPTAHEIHLDHRPTADPVTATDELSQRQVPTPNEIEADREPAGQATSSEPLPRCMRCRTPCWLCTTAAVAGPVHEKSIRWSPEPDSDAESDDMDPSVAGSSLPSSASKGSAKRKFDSFNRLLISVRDKKFGDLLTTSGIFLSEESENLNPTSIAQPSTRPASKVFVGIGDDHLKVICHQLNARRNGEYNELEVRSFLDQELIFRDEIKLVNPTQSSGEGTAPLSYRRDQWQPKRDGPAVETESRVVYDYQGLVPDTTFMVSTSMFTVEKQGKLVRSTALLSWLAEKPGGVAPYLTFEYQSAPTLARNQIAAAAAVWLLQRKDLRDKATSQAADYSDLHHYGIVLTPGRFEVWRASIENADYKLRWIANGDPTRLADLKILISWMNAIHAWGLTAHAKSAKKDLEEVIRQHDNIPPVPLL